jgi:hypothetical protein
MSPRRKPNQPAMKYWGFYATKELKAETIKCAEALNESDSEYIRRAVEQRNTRTKLDEISAVTVYKTEQDSAQNNICSICGIINGGHTGGCPRNKNNTINKPIDNRQNYADSCKAKEEYKAEQKAKQEKQIENHFRPCPKGGK